jgi:myo-inositol-1(or 4)-monophosphatase
MASPQLSDLETLARRAGEIVRAGFPLRPGIHSDLHIEYKGLIDPVTDVDHRSEDLLLGEIRARFPDHAIVTEESGSLPGNACIWYIDPLDGTVNFSHGIPVCCVSIAFAERGQVQMGAVYDPLRDELFTARLGAGAWLNGLPIRVAQAQTLDAALLSTGFPYDIRTNPQNNLENTARFSLRSQGVRRLGSAALDLCYVAAGRFDGFWEMHLAAWDFAAGALIAGEAGARVTNAYGDPAYFVPPYSILAANPTLHPLMLDVLQMK